MTDSLVAELTKAPESKPLSTEDMVAALQKQGFLIFHEDPLESAQGIARIPTGTRRYEGGKTLRFGALSCTHLGSHQQQLTFLREFYDQLAALGIDTVFHLGDFFDGDGYVYRGHLYDVRLLGYDLQLDYGAEVYPHRDGITTYLIAGNHDWSFFQRGGADICAALAKKREDIVYLGALSAQVVLDQTPNGTTVADHGLRLQLTHAKGGLTYARSYKMQKHIEQFAPEKKPEVYLMGNFHSWAHIPMYRNVIGWQMGCFQSQTKHEAALGLYPEIGGLIMEIDYATDEADRPNGIVAIRHEIVPFYVPLKEDF